MAFVHHKHEHQFPVKAGSTLNPRVPVFLGGTSGLLCFPAGSNQDTVYGFNGDATFLAGEVAAIYEEMNIVKAVAAASVGAGALVGIASDNGSLSPAAAASGRFAVGRTFAPAGAGEVVSVRITPGKVY